MEVAPPTGTTRAARTFPRRAIILGGMIRIAYLVSVVFAFCCPALAADPPRPNIVVILADDMGFSDLGCYGGEIETPHIDALAKSGVKFSQFYNTARCCPTRAS